MAKSKENVAYNQVVELCGRKFYSEIKNDHAKGSDYVRFTIGIELKNGARIFCNKMFFGYNEVNINDSKPFIYHNYKVCKQAHEAQADIYIKVRSAGSFGGLVVYAGRTSFDFDFIDVVDKSFYSNHGQKIKISGYITSSYDNIIHVSSGDELPKEKTLQVEIDKTLKNSAKLGHAYVLQGEIVKSMNNEIEFSWDTDYEEREELAIVVKPVGIKRGFIFGKVIKEKELPVVENTEKKITSRISVGNGAF